MQGIQIKWEVLKNSIHSFFSANFMSSFHKDHLGNFDTWLSLGERNLKSIIWMSTSQPVPREMQKDVYTKNWLKKFLPYHHFWKTWSYLWTADLILWILQLRGQACGAQGWVCMLLNVIVIITLKNCNVLTRIYTPNANMADVSVGPGLVARKRG